MSDETPRPRRSDRHGRNRTKPVRSNGVVVGRSTPRVELDVPDASIPEEPSAPGDRPARGRPAQLARDRSSRGRGVRASDSRTRRKTLVGVAVLIALVIAVGIPVYGAWRVLLVPDIRVDAGRPVTVEIPEGAGSADIARLLGEAGVVENSTLFRLRVRLDGVDSSLRSGTYELMTGMEYEAVVARLTDAPPVVDFTTVTIPEGLTIEQTAQRFEEGAGIPASEFIALAEGQSMAFAAEHPYLAEAYQNSLEGYLFPKTYDVIAGSTAADVIEMMLVQFDKEVAAVDLAAAETKNLTLNDVVIIASIIEREARLDAERPLVGSVIHNRLKRDMRLEMCATVEYLLPGTRPRLTNDDLKIDSPYNTYLYAGLPPGPIASPGLASLQAAAAPADTDYLFYVLTGEDGSHTFTATYSEFLKAKEKSREVTP